MVRISFAFLLFPALLLCSLFPPPAYSLSFIPETVDADGDAGEYRSIAVGSDGRVWIAYSKIQSDNSISTHIAVRKTGDWQFETVTIATPPTTDIIVTPAGYPAIGFSNGSTLHYTSKTNGTWTDESIGGFGPWSSALTVSSGGAPFAAYVWSYHYYGYISISARVGNWVLMIQYEDTQWFNPYTTAVDIATDEYDRVHVCVNPYASQFYYFHQTDIGWTNFEEVPYPLNGFSLAVDSQNRPWISYKADGKLRLATKEVGGWTSFVIDDTDYSWTDLVIDANDIPHIAYCRDENGPTAFYATRSPLSGTWEIYEVDKGYSAKIALDSRGEPHLVYRTRLSNPTRWILKYATTDSNTPLEVKSWGELKSLFK
jgi:hypothetical protein